MSNESTSANSGRRLLVVIFIIAAVLLAVSMAVTFRVGHISLETERKMANQLGVLKQLPDLASTIKDSETGQRGYLLTGEDKYLQLYTDSLLRLKTQLADLQKLAALREISKADLDQTSDLIQQKLAELAQTISLRRENGYEAALAEVKTDRGKNTMEQNCRVPGDG